MGPDRQSMPFTDGFPLERAAIRPMNATFEAAGIQYLEEESRDVVADSLHAIAAISPSRPIIRSPHNVESRSHRS